MIATGKHKHKGLDGARIGILGGGQLGRMLIQAGLSYNVTFSVLDPDPEAPCAQVTRNFFCGSFSDYDAVMEFGAHCDILTIEIEHVNTEALFDLRKRGVLVYPQPELIRMVQDKGLQKQYYRENNIASSDFVLIRDKSEIRSYTDRFPMYQKLRRAGYDGRGVHKLDSVADIERALEGASVLESAVNAAGEIAVIVARNPSGEIRTYPAVDMVFHPEKNMLHYLASPSLHAAEVLTQADQIARRLAQSLELVGILAVEMFVTQSGEVLVNEIAPRPHNSGHHTIEACGSSQFDQLLRCITDSPLGDTSLRAPAAMLNLLGAEGLSGAAQLEGLSDALAQSDVYVHYYGKPISKPFRKMGHVTVLGSEARSVIEGLNLSFVGNQ